MERELKTAKTELESKGGELKTKQNQLQKALDDISRLEQQLKEQRVSYAFLRFHTFSNFKFHLLSL